MLSWFNSLVSATKKGGNTPESPLNIGVNIDPAWLNNTLCQRMKKYRLQKYEFSTIIHGPDRIVIFIFPNFQSRQFKPIIQSVFSTKIFFKNPAKIQFTIFFQSVKSTFSGCLWAIDTMFQKLKTFTTEEMASKYVRHYFSWVWELSLYIIYHPYRLIWVTYYWN